MNNSFQRVLSKLVSFYGCVPKIVDEQKGQIYVPAVIARMFAVDLTRMGVRIERIGVWEYVDLVDPPAKWGRKGECDDQGYGRLAECLDLHWHASEGSRAQDLAEVNEAARKFLESLSDTDAGRAVGEARLWVDLRLNCQEMRRVIGH